MSGHGHGGAGHGHGASPPPGRGRAFALGIGLNTAFVVVEAAYGVAAGSVALVSDAAHNLSDVLGLALAWLATVLARRPPSTRRTYGLRKSTVLAALANAALVLFAAGGVAWEAFSRLAHPAPVAADTVMVVAAIGVVVNGASAALFARGRQADANVEGAFLHLVADAAVSVAVVVGGFAVARTGLVWIDPALSLAISAVIVVGAWRLLRQSVDLALDAVPRSVDAEAVARYLDALDVVNEVHHLHIWAMSTTETALTAHLVLRDARPPDGFLASVGRTLDERFGIGHATLQLEAGTGCSAGEGPGCGPEPAQAGADSSRK